MFGRLLGWYAIYTRSGALAPWRNFARCKVHFTSMSCVLLYWQRYCTVLQQPALAKLCGVVQGMKLRNFRRGRHLYSAGRPSRWALAHISSSEHFTCCLPVYLQVDETLTSWLPWTVYIACWLPWTVGLLIASARRRLLNCWIRWTL